MLQAIHVGNSRPISRPVDPNAVFQPGMIGQHRMIGNDIVLGVSDGLAPFGIILDIRDTAYVAPAKDEVVVVVPTSISGSLVGTDTIALLRNSPVMQSSFCSDIEGVSLVATNGAIIVPAGTPLNYKSDPSSSGLDSVRVIVSYSYAVPHKAGDDSTLGSNKVSVYPSPSGCVFATDQYETNVSYPLNAPLFVSIGGRLTTEQRAANMPAVAMVCTPPTSINNMLEFVWL